jgi:ABC-2 type transport system ATP-binding protein
MTEKPIIDILKAVQLSKRFRRTEAVDHLDLSVPEGSIYGLVGPNGAGKTTAIKTMMNIFQPTGGSAEVLGVDSRRLGPREFAQIGYVSENQEMPDWMTVGYFMQYWKPFYPAWDDARAAELLRQFDLPLVRKLKHLSRGMRMKAALASSLAYRPRLIVLDEPFTGLDPLVRDELIEGLLESAEGTTILISSHDLAEIETFASHIGYLDHGHLQFSEEMTSLVARFREIEITLDTATEAPGKAPANWPASWQSPEFSAAVVRFVETQFNAERTAADVRRLFPGATQVSMSPMPLRNIFVALAKASRKAA